MSAPETPLTGTRGSVNLLEPRDVVTNRTVMDAYRATLPDLPNISFGTSFRPPLYNPSQAPGPGNYGIPSTLTKPVISNVRNPPAFSLRSRTRFGDPMGYKNASAGGSLEPGPGAYTVEGKSSNGTGRSPPRYSFPKSRPMVDRSSMGPGPGAFDLPSGLGKQLLSTMRTLNAPSFGTSSRSPEGENDGSFARPGPGEYENACIPACGKQLDSRKKTLGSIRFGGTYSKVRDAGKEVMGEPAPGPGSYTLPGGLGCRGGAGNPFKTAPAAKMSGRTSFGSPFGSNF